MSANKDRKPLPSNTRMPRRIVAALVSILLALFMTPTAAFAEDQAGVEDATPSATVTTSPSATPGENVETAAPQPTEESSTPTPSVGDSAASPAAENQTPVSSTESESTLNGATPPPAAITLPTRCF